MKFLQKFFEFVNSPEPAPTKPSPGTKPDTKPAPSKPEKPTTPDRPSPLRRDVPSTEPNPKAKDKSPKKSNVDEVVNKFFDEISKGDNDDVITIDDIKDVYKNK